MSNYMFSNNGNNKNQKKNNIEIIWPEFFKSKNNNEFSDIYSINRENSRFYIIWLIIRSNKKIK